jgi:antitoxin (DNA-binding transcriptional repressor) of toxin-antitoxin stability system
MKMMEFELFARNSSKVVRALGGQELVLTVEGKPVALVRPLRNMSKIEASDLVKRLRLQGADWLK